MTRAPLWQILLAVMVAAAGAALLGSGWRLYAAADPLVSQGERASGEVVQLVAEQRETRDPDDPAAQGRPMTVIAKGPLPVYGYPVEVPVVRFTAGDGRVHEARVGDAIPGTVAVGSPANLRYLPDDPRQARLESELADPAAGYLRMLPGAVLLLGGLWMARRLARPRV